MNTPLEESCKAVIYQKNLTDEYVVVFIRGDLDVNETKLTNYLGEEIHPGEVTDSCGLYAGFTGPYRLDREKFTVVFDSSLKNTHNLSCGANKPEYHYKGFKISRDIGEVEYVDVAKIKEGGICPKCGKHTISVSRGIEVGNIFQLGTKYTKSMGMQYLDSEGELRYPIMGCYGIGVGRLAASVCEAHHDEYGPIWPMSIAPWQVELCCLRADDEECKALSDRLYEDMNAEKIEVIYDDRNIRPGFMFSDADLIGAPLRVIVSPRNMKDGICEITSRDKTLNTKISVDQVVDFIKKTIEEKLNECK